MSRLDRANNLMWGERQPLEVRRGDRRDAAVLAAFAARIYSETFGHATRSDDLAAFLASNYGERQQAEELVSPEVVTMVATAGEALAGFAQVRRHSAPPCVSDRDAVELWRFYVDGAWQGRGLARELLVAAKLAGRELGGRALWLSVWEINARAIRFYSKHGFRDVGTHPFWVGADRQMDRIMVLEIAPTIDEP